MGMDSGAAATVCQKSFAPGIPIKETEASRKGKYYLAANDTKIGIHGRKRVEGMTGDWNHFKFDAEVADVKRLLASVCKICEAGNRVVFEANGGYIQNLATGKTTRMEATGRGYRLKVWLPHFRGPVPP